MERQENKGCRPVYVGEVVMLLGGRGVNSAAAYIGTHKIEHGETWVRLHVNGKPNRWHITITVSAADLYDIELWSVRGDAWELLGETSDLYFDDLREAVEALYDTAINEHNGGTIFVG